jgi:hypothetical protein
MTSIICWVGVDSRAPASLNIAADSRITWGNASAWDQGRKVFACLTQPHIFGYFGDVLFPALAIPTVTELIDRNLLPIPSNPNGWHLLVRHVVEGLFESYPEDASHPFGIIHGLRSNDGMASQFSVAVLSWSPTKEGEKHRNSTGWLLETHAVPSKSSILCQMGTGSTAISQAGLEWARSPHGSTSRAVFSSLCDALQSHADPMSGGSPQLVSLYRKRAGVVSGVIHHGDRFLVGRRVLPREHLSSVEWRNELFERCDPHTRRRLPHAAKHGRPRSDDGDVAAAATTSLSAAADLTVM